MTAVIHLVRHAAHDRVGYYLAGRTAGVLLGEAGLAQAGRLAERMTRESVAALYASPRERTQQTAQAIAARFDLPVRTAPELDEIDFGSWSGKDFGALNEDPNWRRWNQVRAIARTPAGESMFDVQTRILSLIDRVSAMRLPGAAVLVTHADVIKAALFYYLGLSLDRFPVIDIAPASISTLEIDDWSARIVRVNELSS
jgi:broad specificity phosphatase PhoE